MRRKAGIAVVATAAVMLSGAAGVTAWHYADGNRPVGTWQPGADVERTPVAAERPVVSAPNSAAARRTAAASPRAAVAHRPKAATSPATTAPLRPGRPVESASVGDAAGRQRVGELVEVRKLLDYLGGGP